MTRTYSTYEAKAKLGELVRRAGAGESFVITYRGREVAELRPVAQQEETPAKRLDRLRGEGWISGPGRPQTFEWRPIARIPGALQRFLDDRG